MSDYALLNDEMEKATGNGAMDEEYLPSQDEELVMVRLHLGAIGGAGSGDFSVEIDDIDGVAYDFDLYKKAMAAAGDAVYFPDRPFPLPKGTGLKLTFDNPNGVAWGLTFWTREYKGPYRGN